MYFLLCFSSFRISAYFERKERSDVLTLFEAVTICQVVVAHLSDRDRLRSVQAWVELLENHVAFRARKFFLLQTSLEPYQ